MRIFVCSPLRAATPEALEANVSLARDLTRAVLGSGHAAFTPHLFYTPFLDDKNDVERALGMAAGAAWLRVADELWVYAENEDEVSAGMKSEILLAGRLSVPVRVVYMPPQFLAVKHARERGVRASVLDAIDVAEPATLDEEPTA